MIHTNVEQSHFIGFILDIDPNAIISPDGKEISRVTIKIFKVSPNPARRSNETDIKVESRSRFCIVDK